MAPIRNYLWFSLLCLLLFWPTGILGIVSSIIANRRAAAGDIDLARQASHWARICCWASVVVFLALSILIAAGVIHTSTRL